MTFSCRKRSYRTGSEFLVESLCHSEILGMEVFSKVMLCVC